MAVTSKTYSEPYTEDSKVKFKESLDNLLKRDIEKINSDTTLNSNEKVDYIRKLNDKNKKEHETLNNSKSYSEYMKKTKKIFLDHMKSIDEIRSKSRARIVKAEKRIKIIKGTGAVVGVAAISSAVYAGIKKRRKRKEEESYRN